MPDIGYVFQWRVTCGLNTMWQRFGRAARGPGTEAVAVLFAESKYFDDSKEKAAKAAEARALKAKQKAEKQEKAKRAAPTSTTEPSAPTKRQKTVHTVENNTAAVTVPTRIDADALVASSSDHAQSLPITMTPVPGQASCSNTVLSVYEELRISSKKARASHHTTTSATPSEDDTGTIKISPEMDSFINARTRSYNCYRVPVMAYYENDRRGEFAVYTSRIFSHSRSLLHNISRP